MATLTRVLRDMDLAEEVVQEAFATALHTWPRDGVPANPGAWITTTARNRAIDRLRRVQRGRELLDEITRRDPTAVEDTVLVPVADDLLRLVFLCCHPVLSPAGQTALTLRLVLGLSTSDIAHAFLVREETMAQRLVRSKRRLRDIAVPYVLPDPERLDERLPAVLAVVYVVATTDDVTVRRHAIDLARRLHRLLPEQFEVTGLLALVLLTAARRPAARDDRGRLVLLADQDRTQWDRDMVAEGLALVRACLAHDRPGPYQLQAAIAAVHADAATAADTDWAQVLVLYDHLFAQAPDDVVALNRAVAVAEVHGPAAGVALVDDLDLDGYQPFHAVRAELLHRVGDPRAAAEFDRAADLATDPAVREHLRRR